MCKILIVDDTVALVSVLEELLLKNGYDTIIAYSGDECLKILETEKPDVILMDIMMEPIDGWETLSRIKSDAQLSDIPVMMFTAKTPLPQEMIDYGINIEGYLMKPVLFSRIDRSICEVLGRKKEIKRLITQSQKEGYDQNIISEYADLSGKVDVLKDLVGQMKDIYNLDNPDNNLTGEFAQAMNIMEADISKKEERLRSFEQQLQIC